MWYIHVNQHKIRTNIGVKDEEIDPPIAIRTRWGRTKYAKSVRIPDGSVIEYSPNSPILSCGARLVISCPSRPEIID